MSMGMGTEVEEEEMVFEGDCSVDGAVKMGEGLEMGGGLEMGEGLEMGKRPDMDEGLDTGGGLEVDEGLDMDQGSKTVEDSSNRGLIPAKQTVYQILSFPGPLYPRSGRYKCLSAPLFVKTTSRITPPLLPSHLIASPSAPLTKFTPSSSVMSSFQ